MASTFTTRPTSYVVGTSGRVDINYSINNSLILPFLRRTILPPDKYPVSHSIMLGSPQTKMRYLVTCEAITGMNRGIAFIKCSPAKKVKSNGTIRISSARYGRFNKKTCKGSQSAKMCEKNVIDVVKRLCEFKSECSFVVSNEVMLVDPCQGVDKYLETQYYCQ